MKAQLDPLTAVIKDFEDAKLGYEMAKESGDKDLLKEADEALFTLGPRMEKVELQSLLSGKHDHRNAFLTIQAGAGGKEANDWADMLLRMYIFYCEKMGFDIAEVDKGFGTEVGIDSITLHVKGPYAFGYLNCEPRHAPPRPRLPLQRPGQAPNQLRDRRRHARNRRGRPGHPRKRPRRHALRPRPAASGQNVNKVASAIRVTHIPTGIQVVANSFRDQPQNKKQAMGVLTAKLQLIEDEKREAELSKATGGALERGWGTQIRSYVFYDNRVKDHRTNVEKSDYEAVLRGDIADFIDAELKRRRSEKEKAKAATARWQGLREQRMSATHGV